MAVLAGKMFPRYCCLHRVLLPFYNHEQFTWPFWTPISWSPKWEAWGHLTSSHINNSVWLKNNLSSEWGEAQNSFLEFKYSFQYSVYKNSTYLSLSGFAQSNDHVWDPRHSVFWMPSSDPCTVAHMDRDQTLLGGSSRGSLYLFQQLHKVLKVGYILFLRRLGRKQKVSISTLAQI